jgi:putative transposase
MMDIVSPSFILNGMEIWHVLNRGVEGRDLFLDTQDFARFVHNLYEFNDTRPAENLSRLFDPSGMRDFVSPSFREERELLVTIHGWVLMKNHYHLLLSERVEGGMSLFLRKLNVGYAKYFNERYGRQGTLFQGRTKKIVIQRHAHFLYILHYIHLNPLDYMPGAEKWRVRSKGTIKNTREALRYLETYRWSSYLDYSGTRNFPSLLTVSLFRDTLGNYQASIGTYLRDTETPTLTPSLTLE